MTMKGQYFSFDAIVASVIFILAIVSLLSYWDSIRSNLDFQNSDVSREAFRVSEALLKEKISVTNVANCDGIKAPGARLGFAGYDGRINWTIVQCANDYITDDEPALKSLLSTGYGVTIIFHKGDVDDTKLAEIGTPMTDAFRASLREVYKVRRIVPVVDAEGPRETDERTYSVNYMDLYLYR
ncbi:MAG: hypothetical protein ABII22_04235 [Candidatus Micrarchaeota archaeon]